eukprot:g270.t1
MQAGAFYCYIPKKGAVSNWLPFGKQTQRSLYRRLNALLKEGSCSLATEDKSNETIDESDLFHCCHFDPATSTQNCVFPGAAFSIRQSSVQLTEHYSRKEPNVYSTDTAFIIFCGYISNLDDLCTRMGRSGVLYSTKRTIQKTDVDGGLDMTMGDATASIILNLYLRDKGKDPLLVLSELQGHYSFVIYDSEDKSVFAARDASGQESLYFKTEQEKGGVTLANKMIYLNELDEDEKGGSLWTEVPPGYYLYGKSPPQLQQYALTPDQLTSRWSMDLDSDLDLHFSLEGSLESRRSWSASFRDSILGHVPTLHESEFCPRTL